MDILGTLVVGQNSENQQSDPQHPLSFCIILESYVCFQKKSLVRSGVHKTVCGVHFACLGGAKVQSSDSPNQSLKPFLLYMG
jgi:hypothetical protein